MIYKTIALREPITAKQSQQAFFDDVRENLQEIQSETQRIWSTISGRPDSLGVREIGSIPKAGIKTKTIHEPNPIHAIIASRDKADFIALVFDSHESFELDKVNWLQSNDIEFLIEIVIVPESDEVWSNSDNMFSAKVVVSLNQFPHVVYDLYVDTLFKNYFLKNRNCSNILSPILHYHFSRMKTDFIQDYLRSDFAQNMDFFPLSTLVRDKSNTYDFKVLFNYWLIFLTWLAVRKSMVYNPPSHLLPVLSIDMALRLLPKKYPRTNYPSNGTDDSECLILFLRRSLIKEREQAKRQIVAIFGANAKIGSTVLVPRSLFPPKALVNVRHLLIVIPFKTI